jgi:prolyl oligopeptidase
MTRLLPTMLALSAVAFSASADPIVYPETPRVRVTETLHGTTLTDDYRWLEDATDPQVVAWTAAQERLARSIIDPLPQHAYLVRRYNELWRYEDEKTPARALIGDRLFYWAKKSEQEKWTYVTRAGDHAPARVLIDPNDWHEEETLESAVPSRDGRYVAVGRARGGNEAPIVRVMEVSTGRILPDTLRGWRQRDVVWLPDNAGFYYTANPPKGSVPEGEEYYWNSVYRHRLGTPGKKDERVFFHTSVKEYYHEAKVSEDGRHVIFTRGRFNTGEVFLASVDADRKLTPIATGFDAEYDVAAIGDLLLIKTDAGAPLGRVWVAPIDRPQRESWRELIPEDPKMKLSYVRAVAGHLYVGYEENAHARVRIYDLEGRPLRDLPFPTLGSGRVSGRWSRDDVWVSFSSFTYPSTTFRYDFGRDRLEIYRASPLKIAVDDFTAEQVWYESQDGTLVSMFLVRRKDLVRDGNNPALLTGYGGFNISMRPYFSTTNLVWVEAGGMIAIPNLRGGGEYGREWHEAGMREKKQNVYDDFIAAGEWLIASAYTSRERLAISGGSNGGLLVGAALVQRPDLFRAVHCAVPLLDMIRYHKFGLANIWSEEYGSAEDAEQFRYLLAYSPYQNVRDGVAYPAVLLTGSDNDARTDPLHARKMAARLQAADAGAGPILLLVREASGHQGGTTVSTKIEQTADSWAFLMDQLGMTVPAD